MSLEHKGKIGTNWQVEMDEVTVRLECLKLAIEGGPDEGFSAESRVEIAERYLRFIARHLAHDETMAQPSASAHP